MHYKANYFSKVGFQQRLINVISMAKLIQKCGVYSVPSIISSEVKGFSAGEARIDSTLTHHANLHQCDCEVLVDMIDIPNKAAAKNEIRWLDNCITPFASTSETEYVRQIRRFLKAFKHFKAYVPAVEYNMIFTEMYNFVKEYDDKPYRKLIELGLRNEKVKVFVREEYKKNSNNLRRVVLNLARHENIETRLFVAKHRDFIDVNILKLLAKDTDYRVRGEACWTPETFQIILEEQIGRGEGLPSNCNFKHLDFAKLHEKNKALYAIMYGTKQIPKHRHVTQDEYLDGLKPYALAIYRLLKEYYSRYFPKCYLHHQRALEDCYNEIWWIC